MTTTNRTLSIVCWVCPALFACAACHIPWTADAITSRARSVWLIQDSSTVQELIWHQSSLGPVDRAEASRYLEAQVVLLREKAQKEKAGLDVSSVDLELENQLKHPEAYIPVRLAFLEKMAREPGFMAPPESRCRIVQRSEAICNAGGNPTYVKVLIISGPLKGHKGWGCMGDGILRMAPVL